GMNLQEAGDAPRWHHDGSSEPTGERMKDGGFLEVETGFRPDVLRALDLRGHDVRLAGYESFGGYQAIARRGAIWVGASESRKDGQAAGWGRAAGRRSSALWLRNTAEKTECAVGGCGALFPVPTVRPTSDSE